MSLDYSMALVWLTLAAAVAVFNGMLGNCV